jgi:hypothetical protein
MPDETIHIDVQGLDKIQAALDKFPRQIESYLGQAGDEAAKRVIFEAEGLKKYPPGGPGAPQPFKTDKSRRYFFAALKSGEIEVPYRRGQSAKSERYGTQWYAERKGYSTLIGNRSSYAQWLGGQNQSGYMAGRGWRRLTDVVHERMGDIVKTYQSWVDKLLRDLGL